MQRFTFAIVVLEGLLSTKDKTKPSWEKVFASIEWHLDQLRDFKPIPTKKVCEWLFGCGATL